jgi:hypothetical protein
VPFRTPSRTGAADGHSRAIADDHGRRGILRRKDAPSVVASSETPHAGHYFDATEAPPQRR